MISLGVCWGIRSHIRSHLQPATPRAFVFSRPQPLESNSKRYMTTYPAFGRPRQRSNRDIRNLSEQPWITGVVKSRRLQWAGHVFRAPAQRAIVTAMNGQVNAVRPMGRPRKRWSDNVREDAERLGVGDWRRAALNRDN